MCACVLYGALGQASLKQAKPTLPALTLAALGQARTPLQLLTTTTAWPLGSVGVHSYECELLPPLLHGCKLRLQHATSRPFQ